MNRKEMNEFTKGKITRPDFLERKLHRKAMVEDVLHSKLRKILEKLELPERIFEDVEDVILSGLKKARTKGRTGELHGSGRNVHGGSWDNNTTPVCNVIPGEGSANYLPVLVVFCLDQDSFLTRLYEMITHIYLSDGVTQKAIFVTSQWSNKDFNRVEDSFYDICDKYRIEFSFVLATDYGISEIDLPSKF